MVIAVLTGEDTRKMNNVKELEDKLTKYIKHLQNNTYSLKPHARIFANGDDVMLIGNIAVDLEMHLRNIRQIIREWNPSENEIDEGECWDKMDDRVRLFKDALMQNQAHGEEYRDTAAKLRPILLTSKYTSSNGEPYGNWDDVFVGFMEADPLRDNVAPPQVASANPDREGIFAPTPRGCKPSAATSAASATNEKLLRELYATEQFADHDRMFEVCSKAADLREAIDMMLQ
ncbi:hypothetical protein PENTCL1PPCAC_1709 [Pristionchus entomophagus]|uniref:UBA domain-containing protein n=1 Tax=Pristionchus entomophagus TaxID=358040 RepID=A0AAV5SA44_9BILA|nr:hypothetical protein PENTCL1PPCAC_1709 [Pristionchus entomophagus]